MMQQSESTEPIDNFFLDQDIYCLRCRYNLRGLPGDPVRCPECGFLNDGGLDAVPEEEVEAELARLMTWPRLITVLSILMVLNICICIALIGSAATNAEEYSCLASCMLFPLLFWWLFILRYLDHCRRARGSLRGLFQYQFSILILLLPVIALLLLWDKMSPFVNTLSITMIVVLILPLIILSIAMHRSPRKKMRMFLREEAVERARQRMRLQRMYGGKSNEQ